GHLLPAQRPETLAAPAGHDDDEPVFSIGFCFCAHNQIDLTASASDFTNALTLATSFGDLPCSAIWFTTALPTTQPSASDATSFACAGFEMPKPTAMGKFVCERILETCDARFDATLVCIPVTPSREM